MLMELTPEECTIIVNILSQVNVPITVAKKVADIFEKIKAGSIEKKTGE
jgi:hypothetical protein